MPVQAKLSQELLRRKNKKPVRGSTDQKFEGYSTYNRHTPKGIRLSTNNDSPGKVFRSVQKKPSLTSQDADEIMGQEAPTFLSSAQTFLPPITNESLNINRRKQKKTNSPSPKGASKLSQHDTVTTNDSTKSPLFQGDNTLKHADYIT